MLPLLLAAWLPALAAAASGRLSGATFAVPALVGLGALGPAFVLLAVLLRRRLRVVDPLLLPLVCFLMSLSLVLQARLAPALFPRHLLWSLVGVAVIGAGALLPVPLRLLARYRYTWALSAMALVVLTLVAGKEASPGGPRLWLEMGGLSFQPAEPLKLVLVVFLAGYLEDKQDLLARGSWKLGALRFIPWPYLAPLAVMLGSSLLLLAVQRDLGAALLLYGIGLGLLYVASLRVSYVLLGLTAFALGAAELHARLPVVRTRLAIWLDPWSDAQGFGYQVVQSLLAVAGGGFLGSGLGLGQPTVIPAVHTDFVFSAIAEELGLAGAVVVVLVYALLGLRGLRAALLANGFAALLAAGIAIALTLQALIIMGGVIKLIPLTGITLPFLSYGGTSLITSAFMLGLLLRTESEP